MDYERLREDLIDYFGTAMMDNSMAIIELYNVENASYNELKQIAEMHGFDLSEYENKKTR